MSYDTHCSSCGRPYSDFGPEGVKSCECHKMAAQAVRDFVFDKPALSAAPVAQEPVAYQYRACIAGKWGDWTDLHQSVEGFRNGPWKFRLENGTCELRALYAGTPPATPAGDQRQRLIEWAQSKDPANIGRKTGEKWADEILSLVSNGVSAGVEEDWRDDPSADERWQAGLDYGMERFCSMLGVDPKDVRWDAATEELDGDVCAVIGNVLRVKFGDDFDPMKPLPAAGVGADEIAQIIATKCFDPRVIDSSGKPFWKKSQWSEAQKAANAILLLLSGGRSEQERSQQDGSRCC